jgi:3-keto-5-aminohexanoate cleavage enzyme
MVPGQTVGERAHVPHPLRPYEPLIINTALTGMVAQPDQVPNVPLDAPRIVEDAAACVAAGASILHLHARDADGAPDWRHEAYEEFLPEIRERCPDAILCVTTSGRTFPELERRADVLHLEGRCKPEMASLTLGSLNFRRDASVNAPETILRLAERMREAGVKPELEIFDSGMAYLASELLERGLIEPPLYANVILGGPNTAPARARDLAHLVDSLPFGTVWAAGGLGGFQLPVNGMAVFMGGHVRTGLEDNPWLDFASRTPATNAQLVERVAGLAGIAGRNVALPEQARRLLDIPGVPAAA